MLESISFARQIETAATYASEIGYAATYNNDYSLNVVSSRTFDVEGSDSDYHVGDSQALTLNLSVIFADTAINVRSTLDELQANFSSLQSIRITDGSPLEITAAQFTSDAQALSKVQGPYTLDVTDVSAQAYTGFTQNYDAHGALTTETLTGYDEAALGYASVLESFDGDRRVLTQSYQTSTGVVVASASDTYSPDGSYVATVSVGPGDLAVATGSFSGGIPDGSAASLHKVGAGTLTLSGASSYTGGTTISGGVLAIDHVVSDPGHDDDGHVDALGSGTVTLDGGELRTLVSADLAQSLATTSAGGTLSATSSTTLSFGSAAFGATGGAPVTLANNGALHLGDSSNSGDIIFAADSVSGSGSMEIGAAKVVDDNALADKAAQYGFADHGG